MNRIALATLGLAAAALAGCQTNGPAGPAVSSGPPSEAFSSDDFAWSTQGGGDGVDGVLAFRGGSGQYSCQDVVLIPRTAWSRRRMIILYGSDVAAEVPADQVRARTPSAPSGDYARFVRHAPCDSGNHFSFGGLPDGAWFVITVATPASGGDKVAILRRVDTHGGVRHVTMG